MTIKIDGTAKADLPGLIFYKLAEGFGFDWL